MLGILCASIASVMGTEAIKLITGIGEPLLGRLMVYDALDMTYRTIKIRKDPATPKITELIDYEEFCGVVSDAAEAAADSTITPRELREMMDSGKPLALIDVREQVEWDINRIEGAELIRSRSSNRVRRWPSCRWTAHRCSTARLVCARPRCWPSRRRPVSPTHCMCRAESWRGATSSSPTWSCTKASISIRHSWSAKPFGLGDGSLTL